MYYCKKESNFTITQKTESFFSKFLYIIKSHVLIHSFFPNKLQNSNNLFNKKKVIFL